METKVVYDKEANIVKVELVGMQEHLALSVKHAAKLANALLLAVNETTSKFNPATYIATEQMNLENAYRHIIGYIQEDLKNFEDREDDTYILKCLDAKRLLEKLIHKIADIDLFYGE